MVCTVDDTAVNFGFGFGSGSGSGSGCGYGVDFDCCGGLVKSDDAADGAPYAPGVYGMEHSDFVLKNVLVPGYAHGLIQSAVHALFAHNDLRSARKSGFD